MNAKNPTGLPFTIVLILIFFACCFIDWRLALVYGLVVLLLALSLWPWRWDCRQRVRTFGSLLGFLAFLAFGLIYVEKFVWEEFEKLLQRPSEPPFSLLINLLILALLLGLLRLPFIGLERIDETLTSKEEEQPARSDQRESFPSPYTKLVAMWLLILCVLCVLGLFLSAFPPDWIPQCWGATQTEAKVCPINEALTTLFGVGIGSAIATMLAFLRHAAERKDFERAYTLWYLARPLMGMLLGLIFYFLIRGGLLVAMGADLSNKGMNPWGLAGIGALVGLFSRQAIEKLREVFHTLFRTAPERAPEPELVAWFKTLPEDVREKFLLRCGRRRKLRSKRRACGSSKG